MDEPVAIITGAGTGIGREVALLLGEAGYCLVLVGRREEMLTATAEAVGDAERTAVVTADVADPASGSAIVGRALVRWGRVDAVINNAGSVALAQIRETSADLLEQSFKVNAFAPALLIAAAWDDLLRTEGCVVIVSSMATSNPFPGLSAYASAKSAAESLARSIIAEGDNRIRAFNVAPGAVETDMLRDLWTDDEVPPEQCLDPHDVAEVVVDCVLGHRDEDAGEVIQLQK